MRVELLAATMGHRKGERLEVDDSRARSLIRLGLARKVRKKESNDGS